MEIFDFFKGALVSQLRPGNKIKDLDSIEVMEFETRLKRIKNLCDNKKRIDLDIEETSVSIRKLWMEIRTKHGIEQENVVFHEGAIYEGKFAGREN